MTPSSTYRPASPVPAPRLRDADGSMRQAPRQSAGHAATHPVQPLKGLPGARATDVSYRALAPGGAGFYRICAGTSESQPTAHYSLLTANSTYTFSAKEKDAETGLSYFGSRYYSSDLSIWLSVDPMSDKYPSLSPYAYCANNPVKLVDPNGEDYEVLIDNSNKTITIKATYYVTKDTKEGMEMGFRYFTLQQQNLSYTMEDGESYSIKFDLSIAREYNTWQEAENAKKASGNEFANMCKSGMTQIAPNGRHALGQTETGDVITIRPDCTLSYRTFAHEIGHTLGIGEWSNELMNSDGSILDSGLINEYFQQTMMRTERRLTPDNISSPNAYTKKTNWENVGIGYFKTN